MGAMGDKVVTNQTTDLRARGPAQEAAGCLLRFTSTKPSSDAPLPRPA